MRAIANAANLIRSLVEKEEEREEASGGFLPYRVRKKTISLISEAGKILDIGCGEGLLLNKINYPNKSVYGIDPWELVLKKAQKRSSAALFLGNAKFLPFKSNNFDEVSILNLLYNLPNKSAMRIILREALRVCKRGGRILFDYRNRTNPLIWFGYRTISLHDPDITIPVNAYMRKEIYNLLRSLGVTKIKYYSIPKWWIINSPTYLVEAYNI